MNKRQSFASILALGVAVAATAWAVSASAADERTMNLEKAAAAPATRGEPVTAAALAASWRPTLTQAFGWDGEGVAALQARLARLPSSALEQLSGISTWSGFTGALLKLESSTLAVSGGGTVADQRDPAVASALKAAQKALGDENRDLTFIPVQPCRVFDTRFETSGYPYVGRYTGANTKNFWVFTVNNDGGNFSLYGGNTGCAELSTANTATLNGTAPYAVMIKLTIVGPAAASSYVSAVRSGDTNPAPNLVSAYCDLAGGAPCFATVVVPVCRGTTGCAGVRDISVLSNMALDLAGEVMGYFVKPQATALDCQLVTQAIDIATGTRGFTTLFCPAGYMATGGGVSTGTNDNQVVNASSPTGTTAWFASLTNNSGGTRTYTFSANCCRIPGRP